MLLRTFGSTFLNQHSDIIEYPIHFSGKQESSIVGVGNQEMENFSVWDSGVVNTRVRELIVGNPTTAKETWKWRLRYLSKLSTLY